jgi:GT2 family glycosyltransferase
LSADDGFATTRMDVAIVNFNAREHLRACLASVERDASSDVLVVDVSSSDGSTEMVHSAFPWARLVVCANRGYGAAANRALAETSSDYVLLLNSDTVLQRGSIRALCQYLAATRRAGVVGPRLVNPDGSVQPSCYPFLTPVNALLVLTLLNELIGAVPFVRERHLPTSSHEHAGAVPWVKGAALAIRREAFDAVGGFDESYFMYAEDLDLCYRLQGASWEVHFTPAATVVHTGGASTTQQRRTMTGQLFASLVHFYERHYSVLQLIELRVVLASVMTARLVRDRIRLARTADGARRSALEEDIRSWRATLRRSLPSGSPNAARPSR